MTFWKGYRPPPAQAIMLFPPPPGTPPEDRCECGCFARQHLSGSCGRCGCTVWRPAPRCITCNGSVVVKRYRAPFTCPGAGCRWGFILPQRVKPAESREDPPDEPHE